MVAGVGYTLVISGRYLVATGQYEFCVLSLDICKLAEVTETPTEKDGSPAP